MVGTRFGRLVVVASAPPKAPYKKSRSVCVCDCGSVRSYNNGNLQSQRTQSCGCLRKERVAATHKIHGRSHTSIHNIWSGMIMRCTNPNDTAWQSYGGRGITVCERWQVFTNFLEDMGERPHGKQLDRIDNNKGYSKDNCRWATLAEQSSNKRTTVIVQYDGVCMSVQDWAKRYNIPYKILWQRLRRGWNFERAILK